MQSFLSNIQKALEQQPDTLLSAIVSESSSSRESFELRLNISLPGSLPPLQWCMYLSKSPPSSILNQIWFPVLVDRMTAALEKSSLIKHLKEKDQIIAKLLDQMHADGSDLGKVFPGTAVPKPKSRGNVRQAVGKSIKGMATFDEVLWQNRMLENTTKASTLESLMSEISPIVIPDSSRTFDLAGNATSGPSYSKSQLSEKGGPKPQIESSFVHEETDLAANVEAGDFQRPPSPTKSVEPSNRPRPLIMENAHRTPDPKDGDSTTDVSDEDMPSSQTVDPEPRVVKPSKSLSHVSKTVSPKSPTLSKDLSPTPDHMELDEPDVVGQDTDEATKPRRPPMIIPPQSYLDPRGALLNIPLHGMLQGLTFNYNAYPQEFKGDIHEIVYDAPSEPHDVTARNAPNEADLHVSHPRLIPDETTNLHQIPIATEILCRCNGVPIWYLGAMMMNHVCHNTEPHQPQQPWNSAAAYHVQKPYVAVPYTVPQREQYRPYVSAEQGQYGPRSRGREAAYHDFGEQRARQHAAEHAHDAVRRGRPVKRASPEKQGWKKASFKGKKGSKRW
ncbi:MAG: hypothetical protein OHK93_001348 [Ramalina farinacea]|uniref:XLF-like coiled-coil region domain-containing protein n=1 Tax=Ramalina farinacea TaxID=258253 RepID=A0AA43QSN2_9LECA|nr:hypothetical protein [Ramalina farinacea]